MFYSNTYPNFYLQVLFKAVIAHQCLGSVWSRRDRGRGDAATVAATVEQFNAVSFRVQSTILVDTELKPSQRAKLITKWIDIAQVSELDNRIVVQGYSL